MPDKLFLNFNAVFGLLFEFDLYYTMIHEYGLRKTSFLFRGAVRVRSCSPSGNKNQALRVCLSAQLC